MIIPYMYRKVLSVWITERRKKKLNKIKTKTKIKPRSVLWVNELNIKLYFFLFCYFSLSFFLSLSLTTDFTVPWYCCEEEKKATKSIK